MTALAVVRKALVATIPFVTALITRFAGADSDTMFVWFAAVSALTVAGVYLVPNAVNRVRG